MASPAVQEETAHHGKSVAERLEEAVEEDRRVVVDGSEPGHSSPIAAAGAAQEQQVDIVPAGGAEHVSRDGALGGQGPADTSLKRELPLVKKSSDIHPPKSSYYYGPPPANAAFGTDPIGTIGVHYPREVIRIERDYEHGELCQFSSAYPLELEGRLTPTEFLDAINAINEVLISAYSLQAALVDNTLAIVTLYLSTLVRKSRYEKEMERLKRLIDDINVNAFHGRGLHILWPRRSAFLFLEIEYY